jgi:hypothetical protein
MILVGGTAAAAAVSISRGAYLPINVIVHQLLRWKEEGRGRHAGSYSLEQKRLS